MNSSAVFAAAVAFMWLWMNAYLSFAVGPRPQPASRPRTSDGQRPRVAPSHIRTAEQRW